MLTHLAAPFIPGSAPAANLPLGRYLPLLPVGMMAAWVRAHLKPGDWVFDPLGAHPMLALEAARAGCRVLVASNNPILTLMLQVFATAPQVTDLQSALSELAALRKGEERLEPHIQSLYLTACPGCGDLVPAQAFLWRDGEQQPHARLLKCSRCGIDGEYPVLPADLERLTPPGAAALHRARAIQRAALPDEPLGEAVEAAIKTYLPRPLYVLSTLINKVEGLLLPIERRRLLYALLINALDEGSALWPWPPGRSRPRQINIPPVFRENNLWFVLENAVPTWVNTRTPLPVVGWPELLPETGGICIYPGRGRDLFPLPPDMKLAAVLTVLPRIQQAFWTLSALWTGWLWGSDALLPLRGALERRRYDWAGYAGALAQTFAALRPPAPPDLQLFAVAPELNPPFSAAVLTALQSAGYQLTGAALNPEEDLAQFSWRPAAAAGSTGTVLEGMRAYLRVRGEPADFDSTYLAGLLAVCSAAIPTESPSLQSTQTALEQAFHNSTVLRHYKTSENAAVDSGHWGLVDTSGSEMPLADRVERYVVNWLQKTSEFPQRALETDLWAEFPGLLTPPQDLLQACLESYAEAVDPTGRWRLRPQETAVERRAQLKEVYRLLNQLAGKLGFISSGEQPLIWQDGYAFFPLASAIISRFIFAPQPRPPERCVLVFPGSRAQLMNFKLRRDPALAEASRGWHLLKFRHLRELSSRTDLTAATFNDLLDADPPDWEDARQMKMF